MYLFIANTLDGMKFTMVEQREVVTLRLTKRTIFHQPQREKNKQNKIVLVA